MVKIMKNPIKMDDLGVFTPIFGNTHVIEIQGALNFSNQGNPWSKLDTMIIEYLNKIPW